FVHHEDERLAYATLNVLRRNLVDRSWLVAWLDRFTAAPGQDSWRSAYPSDAEAAARAHATAFLRSLYFQLILTESPPPDAQRTSDAILVTIRRADIGFYDLAGAGGCRAAQAQRARAAAPSRCQAAWGWRRLSGSHQGLVVRPNPQQASPPAAAARAAREGGGRAAGGRAP